jgi:hypothetical protein
MKAHKIVRSVGVAALVLIAPLSHEVGSAAEPGPSAPARPAVAPADAESELLIVGPGQAVPEAELERAFVVLRRADGRVPRAYVWDEPLGCPRASR